MKENTQEKSLVQVNANSIFYKIKSYFRNLFHKDKEIKSNEPISNVHIVKNNNKKSEFIESLKNIENEETLLLKLQKQYRNGEIKEEDLTTEQVNTLCKLYDNQISNLKKSNEARKQRLLEYRGKMQTDN